MQAEQANTSNGKGQCKSYKWNHIIMSWSQL